MPEGTTLERTAVVTQEIAQYLSTVPEVVIYQNYIGTSAPITFNGLVRHYDMRGGSNMADIQVNLLHKEDRDLQSHDIAKIVRPEIQKIAKKYGANVKVIEVPPGPQVLSTLVAEVYGPDYKEQIKVANQVKDILNNTTEIVDVDGMTEDNQTEYRLEVDKEKAMLNGIAPQQVVGNLTYLLKEYPVSNLYDEHSNDNVGIVLALDDKDKTSLQDIQSLKIKGSRGNVIPLSDLVKVVQDTLQKTIYRKDQKRVVYVTADMAGALESPVYAILGMNAELQKMSIPAGYAVSDLYMGQPEDEDRKSTRL